MKKYMSVYEKVKGDIVSGAIKYGQKVPSKRALSDTPAKFLKAKGIYRQDRAAGIMSNIRRKNFTAPPQLT